MDRPRRPRLLRHRRRCLNPATGERHHPGPGPRRRWTWRHPRPGRNPIHLHERTSPDVPPSPCSESLLVTALPLGRQPSSRRSDRRRSHDRPDRVRPAGRTLGGERGIAYLFPAPGTTSSASPPSTEPWSPRSPTASSHPTPRTARTCPADQCPGKGPAGTTPSCRPASGLTRNTWRGRPLDLRDDDGDPLPGLGVFHRTRRRTAVNFPEGDQPDLQQPAVHDTNPPLTAERIAELSRTGQIRPAGPLPVDDDGQVIDPER